MHRRSFTCEFKTSAARLVREQGYSVAQPAQSLGVDPRSIRDWVARFAPLSQSVSAPAVADADAAPGESSGSAPRTSGCSSSARF